MKLSTEIFKERKVQMGVVVLMGLLLLAGCGPQKFGTNSSEQASLTDSAEKPVAKCTADRWFRDDWQTRLMVYEDSQGAYYDRIRMKFTSFPSSFYSIRAIATQVDEKGNEGLQAVVRMQPETKSGGAFSSLTSNTYTDFKSEDLSALTAAGMSSINFKIWLPDNSEKWNLLTIGIYASQDATPRSMSVLIPAVYANPAHHAEGKSALMKDFHPLNTIVGLSNEEYRSRMDAYCF